MARDVYELNKKFLKERGLELKGSEYMFLQGYLDTAEWLLRHDEYGNLHIKNKLNGHEHSVNITYSLLEESDFEY